MCMYCNNSLSLLIVCENFVSNIFGYQGTTNKHHPTQMHWNVSNTKHIHFKAIYDWKWLGSWKKQKLRNTLFLRKCWFLVTTTKKKKKKKMILVWFLFPIRILVSHQNSCFAPLSDWASRCSFHQQPKLVRASFLQLYYHKMYIWSFYVLYAYPDGL